METTGTLYRIFVTLYCTVLLERKTKKYINSIMPIKRLKQESSTELLDSHQSSLNFHYLIDTSYVATENIAKPDSLGKVF